MKVNINHNAVIEIAFSTLIPGKENQFYNVYFPKVFPIVSEYNGRLLFASQVINTYNSEIKSQSLAFFEWPNVETFKKIVQDDRVVDLLRIRNDSLSYINEGNFYKCDNPYELLFSSNKIYSLMPFKIDSYIDNKFDKYEGKVISKFNLLNESIGNLKENKLCIAEWNNSQLIDSFYNSLNEHNITNYFIITFFVKMNNTD